MTVFAETGEAIYMWVTDYYLLQFQEFSWVRKTYIDAFHSTLVQTTIT